MLRLLFPPQRRDQHRQLDRSAGYFRLLQAIDAGEAAEFLADLGTRAVFYSHQQLLDAGLEHVLAAQLEKAGYREVPLTRGTSYHF